MTDSGNNDELQVHDPPAMELPEGIPAPADEMAVADGQLPDHADEIPVAPDDLRARMMRQFEQWVDGILTGETAPPIPRDMIDEALAETASSDSASSGADLYTLFAAVTKLTGEIGLQGRAFKQLNDVLAPVTELPAAVNDLEDAQHASTRELQRVAGILQSDESAEASLPASKDVLGVLFDLVERMDRGLKTFESGVASIKTNAPHGFLARMSGAERQSAQILETVQAMHEGYRLTAARLEAAVQQWGIQRMGRVGEMFDPTTMTAIELDTASGRPAGTVVEIYRNGYALHGEMLSTTQVKVAK